MPAFKVYSNFLRSPLPKIIDASNHASAREKFLDIHGEGREPEFPWVNVAGNGETRCYVQDDDGFFVRDRDAEAMHRFEDRRDREAARREAADHSALMSRVMR